MPFVLATKRSPPGGLSVMNRMLDPLGFDAALKKADFPQPIRTGGEPPAQLITPFLLSVWGAPIDLSMGKVLVKTALWIQAHAPLSRWVFDQLSINGLPLDRDATVMTRYGAPEGAANTSRYSVRTAD